MIELRRSRFDWDSRESLAGVESLQSKTLVSLNSCFVIEETCLPEAVHLNFSLAEDVCNGFRIDCSELIPFASFDRLLSSRVVSSA